MHDWLHRMVERRLRQRLPLDRVEPILTDLAEDYDERRRQHGALPAGAWLLNEARSLEAAYGRGRGAAVWIDFKLAMRSLRSTPSFSAVALFVLTLGIGATTAIYSVVDAVLLKPLPFPRADRLILIEERNPAAAVSPGGPAAAANFFAWRAEQTVFEDLAAFQLRNLLVLDPGTDPQSLRGAMVSASLFAILRVPPLRGALFTEAHQVAGRNRVALISAELWRRRYGADPAIVGRTIVMSDPDPRAPGRDAAWEIVGVMPDGFEFPVGRSRPVDVWAPYVPARVDYPRGDGSSRNYNIQVIARLKDGVALSQARLEMEHITERLKLAHPRWFVDRVVGLVPLKDALVLHVREWMWLLLASVACVLLIACVNIANLLLARATARRREVAIRIALGASRWQIARGFLLESLTLALAGAVLGTVAAYWGVEAGRGMLPSSLPRINDIGLDVRVLAVTVSCAIATGLLCGLVPALRFSRPRVPAINDGGRSGAVGEARGRGRALLLVAEVALAIVLLIGAGLFISSFVNVLRADLGLEMSGVLIQRVQPRFDPASVAPAGAAAAAGRIEQVFDAVRVIPGVDVAAFIANGGLPLSGGSLRSTVALPDGRRFEAADDWVDIKEVSPDYFKALRIAVIEGREFNVEDRKSGADSTVILNTVAAARFFPDGPAVGQRLVVDGTRVVVGVVQATREDGPEEPLRPGIFTPAPWPVSGSHQSSAGSLAANLVLRTAGDPLALAAPVRAAVQRVLPDAVVREPEPLAAVYERHLTERRFNMILLALFGGLGTMIAGVGIYGVMSCLVAQRVREIGVRMALGARPGQILRMVLSRAVVLILTGLALGAGAGWVLSSYAASFLFGIEPHEPMVYAAAGLALMAAGLAAAFVPARRAARVDPMVVLK